MRLRNIPGARDEIAVSPYVIQEPRQYRGAWEKVFPGAGAPLYLEVGMGKGRFLMEMAALHPEINFIGIEMYSSVLLRALQKREALEAEGQEFPNLLFLRMDARELPEIFGPGEVAGIYLNFSDPWPKERHADRRLTSARFLARYEQVLSPEGTVEFKTDNQELFAFSLEQAPLAGWRTLAVTRDLHREPSMMEGNVMTEYEAKFSALGQPICKMIIKPRYYSRPV